ncbi:MAG: OadG family protein [Acidaminococcaceae bacterium]|nr:OadG family protein [Acidaminococcaceae bacterium]
MEGSTSNPWLIAIINMTIVFGVLIVLGGIMKLIRYFDNSVMGTK